MKSSSLRWNPWEIAFVQKIIIFFSFRLLSSKPTHFGVLKSARYKLICLWIHLHSFSPESHAFCHVLLFLNKGLKPQYFSLFSVLLCAPVRIFINQLYLCDLEFSLNKNLESINWLQCSFGATLKVSMIQMNYKATLWGIVRKSITWKLGKLDDKDWRFLQQRLGKGKGRK